MASARPALDRRSPRPGKRGFAKRVRSFVKRVDMLPGFPVLWVVTFAAGVLMIVTGGFNTGTLPLGQRIGFWALLLGWKSLLWQAWFALMVRRHRDWTRAVLIGVVVLNLPLPLEIAGVLTILGIAPALDPVQVWRAALLISLAIFPAMWLIVRRVRGKDAAPPVVPDDGLLHRARTAPEALCAIEAEDHYCRVRRRDGGDALIHYRFGDALGEVAGIQGIQVHRGAWVAADAVLGAVREGRRWMLLLADGSKVPVSATHLPQVRARGWLVAPDQRTLASARLRG